MTGPLYRLQTGQGPIVALAIHDGHELRDELLTWTGLTGEERLREEDPFTGLWTHVAPTRVTVQRSRFEVDMNRPREKAVYRTPQDAWGLAVWRENPPAHLLERSLAQYDEFYDALKELYNRLAALHGKFVVYDLHSYNHRRDGPAANPADAEGNPQVNLGTGTMKDRSLWAPLIDRFRNDLAGYAFDFGGLDVRENVKFKGGNCARWTHETFPDAACVLSLEFKKFFMDEWTGDADMRMVEEIRKALAGTVPGVMEELARL